MVLGHLLNHIEHREKRKHQDCQSHEWVVWDVDHIVLQVSKFESDADLAWKDVVKLNLSSSLHLCGIDWFAFNSDIKAGAAMLNNSASTVLDGYIHQAVLFIGYWEIVLGLKPN